MERFKKSLKMSCISVLNSLLIPSFQEEIENFQVLFLQPRFFETHEIHIVNPFLHRCKPYLSAKGFDLSDEVIIGKSMASDKALTNDPYKGFFLFIDREMFEVSPYVFQYFFQFHIFPFQSEE